MCVLHLFVSFHSTPPTLAESFTGIVRHLQAMVAHAIFIPAFLAQRNAFPQLVLLWKRLNELADRFANAALGIVVPPTVANPSPSTARGPRSWSSNRMPGTVGWLIRMLGGEATELGIELKHLFASAEFAALLEADPGLARLLRPLCRMLCVERSRRLPSALFAPVPARPDPAKPVPARPDWHGAATPVRPMRAAETPWRWAPLVKLLA
jgi:hypothetical protein